MVPETSMGAHSSMTLESTPFLKPSIHNPSDTTTIALQSSEMGDDHYIYKYSRGNGIGYLRRFQ